MLAEQFVWDSSQMADKLVFDCHCDHEYIPIQYITLQLFNIKKILYNIIVRNQTKSEVDNKWHWLCNHRLKMFPFNGEGV